MCSSLWTKFHIWGPSHWYTPRTHVSYYICIWYYWSWCHTWGPWRWRTPQTPHHHTVRIPPVYFHYTYTTYYSYFHFICIIYHLWILHYSVKYFLNFFENYDCNMCGCHTGWRRLMICIFCIFYVHNTFIITRIIACIFSLYICNLSFVFWLYIYQSLFVFVLCIHHFLFMHIRIHCHVFFVSFI